MDRCIVDSSSARMNRLTRRTGPSIPNRNIVRRIIHRQRAVTDAASSLPPSLSLSLSESLPGTAGEDLRNFSLNAIGGPWRGLASSEREGRCKRAVGFVSRAFLTRLSSGRTKGRAARPRARERRRERAGGRDERENDSGESVRVGGKW